MYLILASIVRIAMQVMGDVTLVLENNKHLKLKDYLYVLESRQNLILIYSLNKSDYSIYFNNFFIRKNDSFIYLGMLVDNLFCITLTSLLSVVENNHVSLKRKVPSTNQTYLWHLCLGNTNLNRIQRPVKYGALHSIVPEDFLV